MIIIWNNNEMRNITIQPIANDCFHSMVYKYMRAHAHTHDTESGLFESEKKSDKYKSFYKNKNSNRFIDAWNA